MDRIACAFIPRFELLARAPDPAVLARPCALVDLARGAARVAVASPAAERRGVIAGQRVGQARARCPELVVLPPDEAARAAAERAVLVELSKSSPALDSDGRGGFFLGLAGLERLWPDERALALRIRDGVRALGYPVKVAIAGSAFAAWIAAMRRTDQDDLALIAAGADAAALAEVPLTALGVGERELGLLALLGVQTVGQVAGLPPGALADRLGEEGVRLERLCHQQGLFASPTVTRQPLATEEVALELDGPVEDLEVLLFLMKSLLERLLAALRAGHRALVELTIVATLDDRSEVRHALTPAEPALRSPAVIELIRLWLDGAKRHGTHLVPDVPAEAQPRLAPGRGGGGFAAPVVALRLVATRSDRPAARQLDLLRQEEEREHAARERAVARLGAAFGGGALVRPQLCDEWRPEARLRWQPAATPPGRAAPAGEAAGAPPLALRLLPAPEAIEWTEHGVARRGGPPARVVRRDGPRRLSGGTADQPYDRSYYWVTLAGGELLWLFRDEQGGGYFLHAVAD